MFNDLKLIYKKGDAPIIFLIFALLFGMVFIILTPPFQAPDEVNHFYRSYQISEGHFIAIKDSNRLGGYIPESIVDITDPFYLMTFQHSKKITPQTITSQLKIPFTEKKRVFKDFANTSMYSPISYIPESFSILILRILNVPPLVMLYLTRFLTLIFWAIGIYFILKMIPVYKWLFALLALLPMSLFINSSVSADGMTNLLSFLMIAYILKCAFLPTGGFAPKNFIVILVLTIMLVYAKVIYSALVVLFLLIPLSKFSSKKAYYFQFFILLFVVIVNAALWSAIINKLYIPFSKYNPAHLSGATIYPATDMIAQKHFVLYHPFFY